MVSDSTAYLILHYILLIGLIFLIIGSLEIVFDGFPLWIGLLIAIGVGILYPRVIVRMGVAPDRWEA